MKSENMIEMNKKDYNPNMHSAEHILNQTMVRMFNCGRAFNAHIEKKKSKCDYHINHPLSPEELNEIEKRINDVIESNLPITEEYISREDAEKEFNLTRLPENSGETIRIIRIGNYDACPCSGFHAVNTGDIGKFSIISSNYENEVLRIRFKLE
jgi:Ser-tRNA(Ala) deacylase AlaX